MCVSLQMQAQLPEELMTQYAYGEEDFVRKQSNLLTLWPLLLSFQALAAFVILHVGDHYYVLTPEVGE